MRLHWWKCLTARKRKGRSKDATPAGESKGFFLHLFQEHERKVSISQWVLLPSPLFMHLQLTWLCQCLLELVITSSPSCSDTSDERNTELTQGVAADSWNWLWLLCHPELYRSGLATLKGENGSTLREKRQPWGDANKVFTQCFLYSSFSPFFLGKGCLHWVLSVLRKQNRKSFITLKLLSFRGQGACLQKHLMAQHECILLNVKCGVYLPAKQACQIYNCDEQRREDFFA